MGNKNKQNPEKEMTRTTPQLLLALTLVCITISFAQTTTPTISKDKVCNAVSDSNACEKCFYYQVASGTGARILASSTCTSKRSTSLITNCMLYSGTQTSDALAAGTCLACASGYVLH